MKKIDDPFLSIMPQLDLHGEFESVALVLLDEFISDNLKLRNYEVAVIHGKGTGIIKKSVTNYLKNDKRVLEYRLDNFNDGVTIVNLRRP